MWIPHKNFSHFSILHSISRPQQIIERCVDLELTGFSLTDNSLNGFIPLLKAKKKFIEENKNERGEIAKKLKINVGMSIGELFLIARNLDGYKTLIKTYSKVEEYDIPPNSLIAITNCYTLFFGKNLNAALQCSSFEECKKLVNPGWDKRILEYVKEWEETYKIYFGIQLIDKDTNPINHVVTKGLRWLDKDRCVALAESYYPTQQESKDQWIVLCSKMKTTIPKVREELLKPENIELTKFFKSNQYYIRSEEDLEGHTQIELDNSIKIQEQIEEFDVFDRPRLPKFICPNGLSSDEYLKQICREGWKEKIVGKIEKEKITEYGDRVKHELEVLQDANLSDYFLIFSDIAKHCREKGYFYGPARGSAAGCLTSYLSSITSINPIPFGLIFERFYNAGRNTKDRVSYPDIDFDIEACHKEDVINYIKNKYGDDNVAQIGTFGRLMGRSILTEVLTVHGGISPPDIKKITKILPDEAAIADDLNEMKEEDGESSIVRWSLENQANQLRDFCYKTKEGKLEGQYAKYFEQAIRLEGLIKNEGTHAAGLLIWPENVSNSFPIRFDKQGRKVITYGMNGVEAGGGVKMDILGLNGLDKNHTAQDLINSTKVEEL